MMITFYIILLTTFSACSGGTVLARAGYFLASSPVRNYLIRSGISNLISHSARKMYDVSGYQYVSDQGLGIRKAVTRNFTISEIKLAEMRKRKGHLAINHRLSEREDRNYSERLFNVLNEMDTNTCISRLLCEIGADPLKFGFIGVKVNKYIRSIPPVTWNSLTFAYKEAFQAGLSTGNEICVQHYFSCPYNLYKAVSFLWLIIHPLRI